MHRIATVDIGTNTILLLIAEPRPDGLLTPLADEARFARLGQGLDRSGELAPEAIERGVDILREYRALMDRHEVGRVAAVGTQALREARNAAAFLAPARELLGVEVEVISGEREARLVYQAVAASFPELARGPLVVADVGGGSTEVIVGGAGGVESFTSVPIGAVRMAERYLRSDPPTAEEGRSLIAAIDEALAPLTLPRGVPLVATAGTATNMAAVEMRMRTYDPERIQGARLAPAQVERQLARYLELTVAERKQLPGLEPQRADVIAAGAAIFARLLHRIGAPEMVISDRGVRWGLAYELV